MGESSSEDTAEAAGTAGVGRRRGVLTEASRLGRLLAGRKRRWDKFTFQSPEGKRQQKTKKETNKNVVP